MQVAGKNNNCAERILSIHLLMGGLSFYCSVKNKYSSRKLSPDSSLAAVIREELGEESYDMINIYHNSLDYIIIPEVLFEADMSDAYLMAKGISASPDTLIHIAEVSDKVYLSCTPELLSNSPSLVVNTLPLIAKAICHSTLGEKLRMSYILQDSKLHIAVAEGESLLFAESFPLVSSNDTDFYLSSVIDKYSSKRIKPECFSLFESSENSVSKAFKEQYKVQIVSKENFLNI